MRVERFDEHSGVLVIAASAAKITVRKASSVHSHAEGWFVDWEVAQFTPNDEGAHGRVHFDNEDLAAAFGLTDSIGKEGYGQWLIDRFGGDSANQGKYIRWRNYLNIPCPGTGHDGDPNVSIHLDDTMRNAARKLLGQPRL